MRSNLCLQYFMLYCYHLDIVCYLSYNFVTSFGQLSVRFQLANENVISVGGRDHKCHVGFPTIDF